MKIKHILFAMAALIITSWAQAEDAAPTGTSETPKSPKNTANKLAPPVKGPDSGKNKLFGVADGLFKTKKGEAESKEKSEKKDKK